MKVSPLAIGIVILYVILCVAVFALVAPLLLSATALVLILGIGSIIVAFLTKWIADILNKVVGSRLADKYTLAKLYNTQYRLDWLETNESVDLDYILMKKISFPYGWGYWSEEKYTNESLFFEEIAHHDQRIKALERRLREVNTVRRGNVYLYTGHTGKIRETETNLTVDSKDGPVVWATDDDGNNVGMKKDVPLDYWGNGDIKNSGRLMVKEGGEVGAKIADSVVGKGEEDE